MPSLKKSDVGLRAYKAEVFVGLRSGVTLNTNLSSVLIHKIMRLLSFNIPVVLSIFASLVLAAPELGLFSRTCTVKAEGEGKDDAPKLVSAILDPTCATVEIPKGTTLNISTKMDTTRAKNKHIVCEVLLSPNMHGGLLRHPQLLEGTIKFNDNLDYWLSVCQSRSRIQLKI